MLNTSVKHLNTTARAITNKLLIINKFDSLKQGKPAFESSLASHSILSLYLRGDIYAVISVSLSTLWLALIAHRLLAAVEKISYRHRRSLKIL